MAKVISEAEKMQKNLSSLQKSHPSVTSILGMCQHCTLYQFFNDKCQWERSKVEGVAFVVEASVEPQLRIIFLNRLDAEDHTMDLTSVDKIKLEPPYLMLRIGENGAFKIMGLWFHEDSDRSAIKEAIETGMRSRSTTKSSQSIPAAKPQRAMPEKKPSSSSSQLLSLITSPSREKATGGNKSGAAAVTAGGVSGGRAVTLQEEDDPDAFMNMLSQSTKNFHASTHTDGRPITPASGPSSQAPKTSADKTKALASVLCIGGAKAPSGKDGFLTDKEISQTNLTSKSGSVEFLAPSDLTGIRRQFPILQE